MRVRPPQIVDAQTVADLPQPAERRSVVVDLTDCRLFGADGYAWLGRLLVTGHRIRVTGQPPGFCDRVDLLVPAVLAPDGDLSLRPDGEPGL